MDEGYRSGEEDLRGLISDSFLWNLQGEKDEETLLAPLPTYLAQTHRLYNSDPEAFPPPPPERETG